MKNRWLGVIRLALPILLAALLGLQALGDDVAQANRLMVEAVTLIEGAKTAPSGAERARLLRAAHDRLTEIVQRFPSTELAVQLATGQQIGSVSLAGVRQAMQEAEESASAEPSPEPGMPGAPIHSWQHGAPIVAVAWAAGGGQGGDIRQAPVGGQRVTTVDRNGVAATIDINARTTLRTWRHGSGAESAAISADGRLVFATGRRGAATLHDTATGEVVTDWAFDRRQPNALALFPRGRRALIGDRSLVEVFDLGVHGVSHAWRHGAPVTTLAVSPDERYVLMGLATGEAIVGDTGTGATLRAWEHPGSGGGGLMSAAFSPDGRRVLTGAANYTAVLYDVMTGERLHEWEVGRPVRTVAYSSSGRWVLTGSERYEVALHDTATGQTLRKWRYGDIPTALAFSPDDRRLLMGFNDGTALVCGVRLPQGRRRAQRTELTPEGGCW